MIQFLGTKIGISLILAVAIIGTAATLKIKNSDSPSGIGEKIGSIAAASVENALKEGQLDNADWENTLKALSFGTTTDDIIKNLEKMASTSAATAKPLTATDRFAREFLMEYVKLKESGAPIDESTGLRLIDKLLYQDYGGPATEKVYTESDIRISSTNTLTEVKKYGNTLGTILQEPLPAGYENELVIVNRVYATEKTDDLKKLALNIARYEKVLQNAAILSVPSGLKNLHLSLLNSISAMLEGVRGMALLSTDPVGATKMILRYEEGLKSLEISAKQLSAYFRKQNVIFSSTEPGFVFTE